MMCIILIGLLCSNVVVSVKSLHITAAIKLCEKESVILRCKGYIPVNIPDDVTEVIVTDYIRGAISADLFKDSSWKSVEVFSLTSKEYTYTDVYVTSRAFETLNSLKYLGLHGQNINIGNDSFLGIGKLEGLDMSKCPTVTLTDLLGALNGSERVKQISTLNVSELGAYKKPPQMGSMFDEIFGPKRISVLNVSHTSLPVFNLVTFCEHMCDTLTYVIMTDCHLPYTQIFNGTCPSLRRLDMNRTHLLTVPPPFYPHNVFIPLNFSTVHLFHLFTNIDTVSLNQVLQPGWPPIHNVTIDSIANVTIRIKKFSLTNNGLYYLDLQLINLHNSIEFFDASSNGILYMQPKILTENVLKVINLSNNNFYKMAENNITDFGILFKYFKYLEHINLAANKLSVLPVSMFRYNKLLRSIDLSNNRFEQIDGWFLGNLFLCNIDLSVNNISLLSSKSMKILTKQAHVQKSFLIDLRQNQLLCNQCKSKTFIAWLRDNRRLVVTDNTCLGQNDKVEIINESSVSKLEDICTRTMRIVIITVSSIVSLVTLVAAGFAIVTCRKKKSKKTKLRNMVDKFRRGQHTFKYITFIAFSSEDEAFVNEFVEEPLRDSFSRIIGTDRELICTGDRHFRPGHSIALEMEECCLQSGVVVLVVSKSFCASNHCDYETRIAFTMNKPIILLFKEIVPETNMTPLLRTIFRQYTRVMFKQEGSDFRMSTTLKNVCDSIFDLIINYPCCNRNNQTDL